MDERDLAAAFDMEGGFNDVSLTLLPGASEDDVIARLDRLLAIYGGLGAMPRSLQTSHWYLDNELKQLQSVGLILPIIFLAVAAFLLNVVLTRIVSVQREQIAALKALGYTNGELAWHYMKLSLVIGAAGAVFGIVVGAWMGAGMTSIYNDFFRFPVAGLPAARRRRGDRACWSASSPRHSARSARCAAPWRCRRPRRCARSRRRATDRAGSNASGSPGTCRRLSA